MKWLDHQDGPLSVDKQWWLASDEGVRAEDRHLAGTEGRMRTRLS